METTEVAREQDSEKRARPSRIPQVTDRDRHLMALLALARYLTADQLCRGVFAGRQEATRKRLLALSSPAMGGETPAYLRRIFFRTFEGNRVAVWALGDAGYSIAERVLGPVKRPHSDVGVAFLEHTVVLNELLLRLLAAGLPPATRGRRIGAGPVGRVAPSGFARLPPPNFRWIASDSAKLPWTEYEPGAQATRQRVIQPDAVLELVPARRRIFVECEMGTHSVLSESDEKSGATMAKVDRYEAFISGLADPATKETFYARTYPDGFTPEVLFLVRTDSRAGTIKGAVDNWRKSDPSRRMQIRAQTLESAVVELLRSGLFGTPNSSPPTTSSSSALLPEEVDALRRFYSGTYSRFKAMRDDARARQNPVPEYPPGISEVARALTRLGVLKPKAP